MTDLVPYTPPQGLAVPEKYAQAMEVVFPRVGIPTGGGLHWSIPTADPNRPEAASEIVGVIVDAHPTSILWLTKMGEGVDGEEPAAYSDDGVHQVVTESGKRIVAERDLPMPAPLLADCPYNEWGSKVKYIDPTANERAKANSERWCVYIWREGDPFPIQLSLSPTSVRPFRQYLAQTLPRYGVPYAFVTRITLEKIVKGNTYSRAVFELVGQIDPAVMKSNAEWVEAYNQKSKRVDAAPVTAPSPTPVIEAQVVPSELEPDDADFAPVVGAFDNEEIPY